MAITQTSTSVKKFKALQVNKLANDIESIIAKVDSQDAASYYMQGNATATTISVINTFYKVAGTTTANALNSGFTHDNNQLTSTSNYIRRYKISWSVGAFTAGNGNVVTFGVAVNGTVDTQSKRVATASSAGVGENVNGFAIIELDPAVTADYVEIWVANASSANVTVSRLDVCITPIS